jgi:hypothetical protein
MKAHDVSGLGNGSQGLQYWRDSGFLMRKIYCHSVFLLIGTLERRG